MAIRRKWAIYLALCLLLVGALSAPLGAAAADDSDDDDVPDLEGDFEDAAAE